jgi:hypothetical protein
MPEVGNDKNAAVERGGYSAVQNALIGPLRPILRRNAMSAFGGTAEVWVERALMT